MKKSLIMASLLLAGSSAMAGNIQPFVGLDISKANADIKDSITLTSGSATYNGTTYNISGESISYKYDSDDTVPMFKIGAIIDEQYRAYISSATFDGDNSSELKLTTLSCDYFLPTTKENITPYIGAFIGKGELDVSALGDQLSNSGNVYGVQAGAIIPTKNNLEFDISIGYIKTNIDIAKSLTIPDDTYYGITTTSLVAEVKTEVEDAIKINFGVNYKF